MLRWLREAQGGHKMVSLLVAKTAVFETVRGKTFGADNEDGIDRVKEYIGEFQWVRLHFMDSFGV